MRARFGRMVILFRRLAPADMSIRAFFYDLILRQTVKKQLSGQLDIASLRKQMDSGAAPKTPDTVTVIPVDANGVTAEWVTASGVEQNRVLLYLHGGGYVFGSPLSHRALAWRLTEAARMRVLMVDYRLAPEHPFPAAVEDATAAYRWLLDEGYDPGQIAVGGDSAGGGLAVALLVNLKNVGLPRPACAILLSPWTDLTCAGASVETNASADAMLTPEVLRQFASLYVGARDLAAPLASPLFADVAGLPTTLIQVGSTEVLLSDAERLASRLGDAGCQVMLDVWPKMPHVWQLAPAQLPEGRQAIDRLATFLCAHTRALVAQPAS